MHQRGHTPAQPPERRRRRPGARGYRWPAGGGDGEAVRRQRREEGVERADDREAEPSRECERQVSAQQITARPGDSPRSMTPTNPAGVGRPPSSDTSTAPAAPAEASHPRVGQGDGEERAARGRHSRARLEHGGNPVGTPIATNAAPAFQPGAVRRRSVATADRWSGRRGEELSGPENGCETAR